MNITRNNFSDDVLLTPLLQQIIDIFDIGIAAIDSDTRLILANDAARQSLSALIHLGDIGEPVVAGSTQFRLEWITAFSQALRIGFASYRIGNGEARQSLALRRISMAGPAQEIYIVLVIGSRRSPCSDLALDDLASESHLTPAEQQVLKLLAEGKSPGEVASLRHSSEATVRTQIKTILQKTRASSFRSLLLMLASMPPITIPGERFKRVA